MTADRSDDDEVRRLLAGSDDPGPVPDDLVARISASIEAEEQRRLDADRVCRFDPAVAPPRGRRRTGLALAAAGGTATAVVLLAVIAVPGAIGPFTADPDSDSDSVAAPSQALVPSSPASAAGTATPAPVAGDLGRGSHTAAPFVVVSSGVEYHRGEVANQAREVTRSARTRDAATATGAVAQTTTGVTVSRRALEACLASLSLPGAPVLVDVARFDGRSALVVLTDTADGGRAVTVVPQDCGTASARTLAGPYPVR